MNFKMNLHKHSNAENMNMYVRRFFLGCLEMWIFSIKLVLTFWFVTIGIFWSLTLGAIIDLKNRKEYKVKNKPISNCNFLGNPETRKVYLNSEQLLTRSEKQ